MLRGSSNNLGRTVEAVELVRKNPDRMKELFHLFYQEDEWVRMRTNSVLKRLWRIDKELIKPCINKWVNEVSGIDQPSIQWTFAQMVEECSEILSQDELESANDRIKSYIKNSDDWIVLSVSIQTLSMLAKNDITLARWLRPKLVILARDHRKSVAKRAEKALSLLR